MHPAHAGEPELADAGRPDRSADPGRGLGQWTHVAGDDVDHLAFPLDGPVDEQERIRAQASGQSVTLTIPVSSSSARKTVPLAVIGCCRVTTRPPIRTGPGRCSLSAEFGTAPSRSSASRNSPTTCCLASSEMTA